MHITHVDGVPVARVAASSEHVRATMAFGVGVQDETARTVGVSRLIAERALEEAVVAATEQTGLAPADFGVVTTLGTTRPWVSGPRDTVKAALGALCEALSRPVHGAMPSIDDVSAPDSADVAFSFVLGLHGPGAAAAPPMLDALDPETLEAHRSWFTSDNVALGIEGDLSENMELPLPHGSVDRPAFWVRDVEGPLWVQHEGEDVVLLLRSKPGDPGTQAILTLLVHALPSGDGGVSRIVSTSLNVPAEDATAAQDLHAVISRRPSLAQATAADVMSALVRLRDAGPGDVDLRAACDAIQARHEVPGAELDAWLEATSRGASFNTWRDLPDAVRLATPSYLATAAQDVLNQAALLVPYGVEPVSGEHGTLLTEPSCPVVTELPEGQRFRPGVVFRTFSRKSRRVTVVVGGDALGYEDDSGAMHQIAWDDVVCVLRDADEPALLVHGYDGCSVPVHAALLGTKCVDALLAAADAHAVPVLTRRGLSTEAI